MKRKILKILPVAAVVTVFFAATLGIHYNQRELFVFFEKHGMFSSPVYVSVYKSESEMREYALADLKKDSRVSFDQSLMLVNTEYMLDDGFVPHISEYKDTDVYMNHCMLEAYASLSAAVSEEFGEKLYVSDDFRTAKEQEQLYIDMPDTATKAGASEHQTGLALDVYAAYFAGDAFIKSPIGRFVNSECYKYGFIIRYPSFGEDVTGIRFEPWHIRYVGHPHAKIIYNNHLTLEEYILSIEIGRWYEVDGYLFCRQAAVDGELTLPEGFKSCTVSPDNTGYYIVTVEK
jgi:D-alanyl-D-alanine carboxypeptidase